MTDKRTATLASCCAPLGSHESFAFALEAGKPAQRAQHVAHVVPQLAPLFVASNLLKYVLAVRSLAAVLLEFVRICAAHHTLDDVIRSAKASGQLGMARG